MVEGPARLDVNWGGASFFPFAGGSTRPRRIPPGLSRTYVTVLAWCDTIITVFQLCGRLNKNVLLL